MYRQPALARQVHTQHGPYIDVLRTDDDAYNPCDLGYQLTRRASGLPIWFALALHGVDAHRDAIRHGIRLAAAMADALEAHPLTELVMRPELGVVLFRRAGWGADEWKAWATDLLRHRHRVRRAVDVQGRAGRPTGVHAPAHTGFDHRRVDAQPVSVTSPRGVAISARSCAPLAIVHRDAGLDTGRDADDLERGPQQFGFGMDTSSRTRSHCSGQACRWDAPSRPSRS